MCISLRNRPGATGGHFEAVPPKNHCLCPSSEDCAPKKVTGSVPLECNSRPETPKILVITPEFVSKNCLFADFAIKTLFLLFLVYTPEFVKICARIFRDEYLFFGLKIRAYIEMKTTFFWSSPQKSWKSAHISR